MKKKMVYPKVKKKRGRVHGSYLGKKQYEKQLKEAGMPIPPKKKKGR